VKLIVGLGNPGSKYARTRHNIGFMVVDELAKHNPTQPPLIKGRRGEVVWGNDHRSNTLIIENDQTILIKPQTFMNNSGVVVSKIIKKHNLAPQDILILMDDLDMELGKLRYRTNGSSGGHKGMQSIIDALGTSEFARLKIGIGRPPFGMEPDEYVTQKFTPDQLQIIQTKIPETIALIQQEFLS